MFLRLHPLPATSLTLSTLLHLAEAGHFHVRHSKVFESAVILRGNEGWKEYQKRRSHRGFGRVERLLGKLNQEGAISLEEHRQLDNGVTFDDLLDVERRSWKARWGFRMDSRAYRGFFRRAAEAIASKGWLVVSVLRLNGRVIAFDVAADFEGNVEDLKMSYDAAYRRYSPGNNVKIFMLKRRMEEGANRISFGWGITPGKERWMDTLEDHHELFIFRAGFLGRLLFFLYLQTPVYKVLSRLWRFKNDILRRHHVY